MGSSSGEVAYGQTPKYEGATPVKPATAQRTYEFAGWDPQIVAATEDATYTATYTEAPVTGTLSFDLAGGTLARRITPQGVGVGFS